MDLSVGSTTESDPGCVVDYDRKHLPPDLIQAVEKLLSNPDFLGTSQLALAPASNGSVHIGTHSLVQMRYLV